jgi:hypothetical protein
MKFKIVSYLPEFDKKLLDLFYSSIFFNKKEFDYKRVPNHWIYRYKIHGDFIIKLATLKGEIIASLGVLIQNGIINGKKVKTAYFVDNCILPKYLDQYEEVFSKLFEEIEKDLKKINVEILQGWDFLEKIYKNRKFFRNMGFIELQGVNWFSSGINLKRDRPLKWEAGVNFFWKIFFKFLMFYYNFRCNLIKKVPENVVIRTLHDTEIDQVYEFCRKNREDYFFSHNSLDTFKNLIDSKILHAIIAERDSRIVGVLTYVLVAWGGWMFKKPFYDKNSTTFFGFTPDEFEVSEEYKNSSLPPNMIKYLMKINSSGKELNFIATVFNRKKHWKTRAYKKLGFAEPKFDNGAILIKSLNKNLLIDPQRIWSVPAQYIIAPVPFTVGK